MGSKYNNYFRKHFCLCSTLPTSQPKPIDLVKVRQNRFKWDKQFREIALKLTKISTFDEALESTWHNDKIMLRACCEVQPKFLEFSLLVALFYLSTVTAATFVWSVNKRLFLLLGTYLYITRSCNTHISTRMKNFEWKSKALRLVPKNPSVEVGKQ